MNNKCKLTVLPRIKRKYFESSLVDLQRLLYMTDFDIHISPGIYSTNHLHFQFILLNLLTSKSPYIARISFSKKTGSLKNIDTIQHEISGKLVFWLHLISQGKYQRIIYNDYKRLLSEYNTAVTNKRKRNTVLLWFT